MYKEIKKAFAFTLVVVITTLTHQIFADTIPNGGSVGGFLGSGNTSDTHSFTGSAGQRGLVSVSGNVTTGEFYSVFNPDGSPLTTGSAQRQISLTQSGTYTVVVERFQASGSGNYEFYLALAPGANEHGNLPNGGSKSQSINVDGEIDSFTFNGTAGQRGLISISGNVSTEQFYYAYNPDGTLLTSGSAQRVVFLTQTGTYTVIVQSFQPAGTGDYTLYLALSPGANEHGNLPNGGSTSQNIDVDGEIDSFTFNGTAGQRGLISISGTVSTAEFFYAYNPDGTLLTSGSAQRVVSLTQTGTYTVIVQSFQPAGTGAYTLYLALSPGANEHGDLPNGGSTSQSIDADGEVDSFTFNGTAGQRGLISISGNVSTGQFYYAYNPDGTLLTSGSAQRVVSLIQTGTYTVIVQSFQPVGTGDYTLYLALAPGANEHGVVPNGGSASESIDANGEIDSFTFVGDPDAMAVIAVSGSVSTGEFIRVYGPNGLAAGQSSGQVTLSTLTSGLYTVVVQSFQSIGTGAYTISVNLICASAEDLDGDFVADACDNCTSISNNNQIDIDGDGFGNACDSDFNNDCVVNFLDIASFGQAFLSSELEFDLNTDGVVNFLDLSVLSTQFLMLPGPSGQSSCTVRAYSGLPK